MFDLQKGTAPPLYSPACFKFGCKTLFVPVAANSHISKNAASEKYFLDVAACGLPPGDWNFHDVMEKVHTMD